jgi:Rrf2 family protein
VRLSEGVEWAVHCCAVLSLVPPDRVLPASRLAEYHEVAPAYLAKHLQALAQAGIVESVPGRTGGYRLARPAAEISLDDVVRAVEGDARAFRCTEIRRRGPAASPREITREPCAIAAAMWRAEEAWRAELATTSIADIVGHVAMTVAASPVTIRRAAAWYQEAMR